MNINTGFDRARVLLLKRILKYETDSDRLGDPPAIQDKNMIRNFAARMIELKVTPILPGNN